MEFNDRLYFPPILPIHLCLIAFLIGLFSLFYFQIAIISLLILCIFLFNRKNLIVLLLICYIFGFVYLFIISKKNTLKDVIPVNKFLFLQAKIKSIKTFPGNKTYVVLNNVVITDKNKKYKLDSQLLWKIYDFRYSPLPGQNIRGKFKIKPLKYLQNPGTLNYTKIYNLKNIHFVCFASKNTREIKITGNPATIWSIKQKIKNKLLDVLKSAHNKGLMLSLIIGDRSYITYEQMEKLQKASLSHIIAQSGLHVGFVALMGYSITHLICLIYPYLFLKIPKQKIGCLIACLLVIIYLCISEPRMSIIRASIMFFCWAFLFYFNYKYATVDGIFISLLLITLYNPTSIFDIGMQLSYISVTGIIITYPQIYSFLKKKINNKLTVYFCSILFISFIVQLSLLPLILYYFGEIQLNFFTNIIFIPLIGFIVLPLLFVAIFFMFVKLSSISLILVNISDNILTVSFNLLSYLEKINFIDSVPFLRPNSYMIVGYYLLLLALFFLYQKNLKKGCFLSIVSIFFIFIPLILNRIDNDVKISVLDVGHGQSILISYKNKRVLIDGGGSYIKDFDFGKTIISPILTYLNFPSLDKVILTHSDIDHIGGLFYLAKKYKIKEFYYNGIDHKYTIKNLLTILKHRHIPVITINKGDKISINNDLKVHVLNPPTKSYNNENDNSLVLNVFYKDKNILLISSDVSKRVLDNVIQKKISPLIFVVPHHGSRKSFSLTYLKNIDSKIWVVSTGYLNKFRLPSTLWTKFAKQNDIYMLNTAYQGCIEFKINNKTIITTQGAKFYEKSNSTLYHFNTFK